MTQPATETIANCHQPPTWNLTVNSTEPILFYCSAPESCTKYGMVGVINPVRTARFDMPTTAYASQNSSQTLDHQHALALDAGYTVQPGQDVPNEEEGGTTTLLSAATVSSTNVGSSRPTPTSSQPPVRVLVSVLCAVLVVVALIATTVIICFKWRSRRHTSGDAQAAQPTARDGSAPDTTTISDRATQSENYHSPFSPSDQGVVDHASELEGSSSPASSTSSPYSVHGIHEVMNTSAHGS